jgi:hypothetical protein
MLKLYQDEKWTAVLSNSYEIINKSDNFLEVILRLKAKEMLFRLAAFHNF